MPKTRWNVGFGAALAIGMWGLTGCQRLNDMTEYLFQPNPKLHRLESMENLASTHIAITYVEAWDAVAPTLSPDFQITG